jgi:hypothetical protein
MHRVNVIMDMDPEDLMDAEDTSHRKKVATKKEKTIKINDDLFDIAMRKGLIEKTDDGYIFIGEYEDLVAFKEKRIKNIKNKKSFAWLD